MRTAERGFERGSAALLLVLFLLVCMRASAVTPTPLTEGQTEDVRRLMGAMDAVVRIRFSENVIGYHHQFLSIGIVEESFSGPLKVGSEFVFCGDADVRPPIEVVFLKKKPVDDLLGYPVFCTQGYLQFRRSLGDGTMVADYNAEMVSAIGQPGRRPGLYRNRYGVGPPLVFDTPQSLPGWESFSKEEKEDLIGRWQGPIGHAGPDDGSPGMGWDHFLQTLRDLGEEGGRRGCPRCTEPPTNGTTSEAQ